jgi:DNA repair protein REV1
VDIFNSDKGKGNSSKSLALPAVTCDSVPDDAKLEGYRDHKDSMHSEEEHTKVRIVTASCSRASALAEKTTKSVTQLDLMPDSLSQTTSNSSAQIT